MREKFTLLPTPIAGLALAIASLGWSWENVYSFNGQAQITGALIAALILLLLGIKFMLRPKNLCTDLQHPVVGSVVPTFAMGLMVISSSLAKFFPLAGNVLWLFAVGLHLFFLAYFAYYRARDFQLEHLVPSWFVPPIGIVVANVSFSGNQALLPIADFTLYLGLISYAILLPLMIYRLIFLTEVADAAKPSIAILAAPASLNLAGYLTTSLSPSPVIVMLLFGIAILMTFVIYLSFIRLLKLPFTPAYAAFTFPMVIGATALFKVSSWMQAQGVEMQYIQQVRMLAKIELVVASAVVLYVAAHYRKYLVRQWKSK